MHTSLKKCSHHWKPQKTEFDTTTFLRILLIPAILAILLFIQGAISIFIGQDLRTRKFRHEFRKEKASEIYLRRLQDCNKCFEGEYMRSCNQLVFTCPLYLRYKIMDDNSGRKFESDVTSIYSSLSKSKSSLIDDGFYCHGFFQLFILNRDADCRVDIGSSTEIALVGVSAIIQKHIDEEYGDSEIMSMDWNFVKDEVGSEDEPLPLYSLDIQFTSRMEQSASSTIKQLLFNISQTSPWTYYFDSVTEIVETKSGLQRCVKISFSSKVRYKPHYA